MTLNLTVTTRRCIYQSADYRLLDLKTGETFDFETQKIVLVNAFGGARPSASLALGELITWTSVNGLRIE
jgi:hypothetical protein